jgi:ribose transport system substrate-binding protein
MGVSGDRDGVGVGVLRRGWVGCVAAVMVVGGLGACGSGASKAASSTSNPSTATSAVTSGSGVGCAGTAAAAVTAAENLGSATSSGPVYPPPVNASIAKGKTIWGIELNGGHPSSAEWGQGLEAAASSVGAKTELFDGKGTPSLFVQGVETAVAQKAAAIVLMGIDPALVSAPLADAKAAHIPVIYAMSGDPNAVTDGVFANSTTSAAAGGTAEADLALAQTNCSAHILAVYDPTVTSLKINVLSAQAEVARLCPTNCSFKLVEASNANAPTTTQILASAFQVDPDTNYLIGSSTTYVPYMQAAEQSLQKSTPLASWGGDSVPAASKGTTVQGFYVFAPYQIDGYYFFDAVLDALHGVKNTTVVPSRLLDKSNWNGDPFPGLADYTTKFSTLWGGA